MKALVIYDLTGRIWNIIYGEEAIPQGLTCMWVDIPEGAQLQRIDLTNSEEPKPVFTYLPESDIGRIQEQVRRLQKDNEVLNAQVAYLAMMSDIDMEV
ncbi:hypothetical protein [Dysgonomonas gadei]|uniref:hypothetical protein n=1 Tax=Dysgonomonas gadei TaxID=156974 RepID=UPI003AF0289B